MGYSGLDSWGDSDNASCFIYDVFDGLVKKIKKELKLKDNEFNTDGVINVYFYLEEFVFPISPDSIYQACDDIIEILDDVIVALEKILKKDKKEEWESEENRQFHLGKYKEFIRKTKKYRNRIVPTV
jgi:hypothetical protein